MKDLINVKKIWQVIKSQRVNVKMIPVKLFGSFLYLATLVTFPYLTLQMLNIGLTMNDVSIVYGIVPIMTFLTSPLAGRSWFPLAVIYSSLVMDKNPSNSIQNPSIHILG